MQIKQKYEPFTAFIITENPDSIMGVDVVTKVFTCLKKARDYGKRTRGTFVMTDIDFNPIYRSNAGVDSGTVKSNSSRVFAGAPDVKHLKNEYTQHIFKDVAELERQRTKKAKSYHRPPRNSYHAKRKRVYKAPSRCVSLSEGTLTLKDVDKVKTA